jgi:hypothetical protein
MAVTNTTSEISYVGDGTTNPLSFPWIYWESTDITVYSIVAATGNATLWTLGSQYTLTGGSGAAGSVVPTTATVVGTYTLILLKPVQNQPTLYVDNEPFPSQTVQENFDRLTQMVLYLQNRINSSIVAPESEVGTTVSLPSISARASKYLYFDASGNLTFPTVLAPGTILTAQLIGSYLYPQTALEALASVTPADLTIPAGPNWAYLRRYNSLSDALLVAGANAFTLYVDAPVVIGVNTTIPTTLDLVFIGNGSFSTSATFTTTVNGLVVSLGTQAQTFSGAGTTTFNITGNQFTNGNMTLTGTFTGGALVGTSASITGGLTATGTAVLGASTFNGAAQTVPVALAFSATAMVMNCSLSNVFKTTFTANVTVAPTFTNLRDGQSIVWRITQDATGSRTMTWPTSFKWPGAVVPTLSTAANAVDRLDATYYSDTGLWQCALSKAFG